MNNEAGGDEGSALRVALFGGTFDPPHRGHLAVARAAADRFRLDRVLCAPTGVQPLKPERAEASFADRLAMLRLTAAEDPRIVASSIDAPLPGGEPNFTVDTLRKLRDEVEEEARLYVIVGADAFLALRRWRSPEKLLELARWIVVSRPGFALEELAALNLTAWQRARVDVLGDLTLPISATEIRRRLHTGDPCSEWLLPGVSDYIFAHALYGSAS